MRFILIVCLAFATTPVFALSISQSQINPTTYNHPAYALRVADYLLGQQHASGVIPDGNGGTVANVDSTMEYALIGLAAAYWYSRDSRYLNGLEKGIHWLAAREDMSSTAWRGSWYYAYSTSSPYSYVAISPGAGVTNVRGVDSTSTLFVYLLYLHKTLSGSDTLARLYEPNARAALNFVLTQNRAVDGYFYSSWQKWGIGGSWELWPFRYAADQGDNYLGFKAGVLLYGDAVYQQTATRLEQVSTQFFDTSSGTYAVGTYDDGSLEIAEPSFSRVFPQGYLPWIFGANGSNVSAFQSLYACEQSGGAPCTTEELSYSLTMAVYALAASALNYPAPTAALDRLIAYAFDPADGAVRDTTSPDSYKYSNVAGLTVAALVQFPTLITPDIPILVATRWRVLDIESGSVTKTKKRR